MDSPGPLDAIKLVVQQRLVTATYLQYQKSCFRVSCHCVAGRGGGHKLLCSWLLQNVVRTPAVTDRIHADTQRVVLSTLRRSVMQSMTDRSV